MKLLTLKNQNHNFCNKNKKTPVKCYKIRKLEREKKAGKILNEFA